MNDEVSKKDIERMKEMMISFPYLVGGSDSISKQTEENESSKDDDFEAKN